MPAVTESPPARGDAPAPGRLAVLTEVALAYGGATLAAAALYRLRALDEWFHVLVAALFLYLPAWLLRDRDLADYGVTTRPLGRSLALLAATVAVVFPLFLLGFVAWQAVACGTPWLRALAPTGCEPGPVLSHLHLRWPPSLVTLDPRRNLLLAELLVVALPEELFFRGYLQGRLAEALPATRRLLGAPVGWALVLASALFALSHLAVQGSVTTLAVFFPGLVFGWMRARTGSILAGTLFHALCNVYIDTLARSLHG